MRAVTLSYKGNHKETKKERKRKEREREGPARVIAKVKVQGLLTAT